MLKIAEREGINRRCKDEEIVYSFAQQCNNETLRMNPIRYTDFIEGILYKAKRPKNT